MGMSIDRAVKKLKGQQADFNEQYVDFGGINDAFNTAYEVMEKYQKIVQVYNSWRTGDYKGSTECIEEIGEVVEDGNDN